MPSKATSYGVVTKIAPSFLAFISRKLTIEMCSSEVPGGAIVLIRNNLKVLLSIIKKSIASSSVPQSTSKINYSINFVFLGPLQITASFSLLSKKPIDITARLSSTQTGFQPEFEI